MKTELCARMIRLGLLTVSQSDHERSTGAMTFHLTDRGRQFDDEDRGDDAPEREVTAEQVERRFEKILRKATSH